MVCFTGQRNMKATPLQHLQSRGIMERADHRVNRDLPQEGISPERENTNGCLRAVSKGRTEKIK
jgi:hypothetical protein